MKPKQHRYTLTLLAVLLVTLYLFHVLFGIEKLASESLEVQTHNTYFVFTPWQLCAVLYVMITLPVSLLFLGLNSCNLIANVATVIATAGLVGGCTAALDNLHSFSRFQPQVTPCGTLTGTAATQQAQIHFLQSLVQVVYVLQVFCILLLVVSGISVGRRMRTSSGRTH
ncbi:hypothetical protein [Hymenobacter crusticola]|uniref:Uncharacterized protein n=1 Tax=Hymenobacter crusticola TaxID=1770526 RepID=A0A243WJD1_9BACT|nr:hypothetical protein [Hymenobacter crusticola]OUJ76013.1 hypothetical protein BXP70_01665 [Hymenobacter crusticola]